jgi:hypothetical protein
MTPSMLIACIVMFIGGYLAGRYYKEDKPPYKWPENLYKPHEDGRWTLKEEK